MHNGYGSFHQRYFIDDRLVAVAVLDILPHCFSSVYVYYDPALPQLELGKLTALREIQWVQAAMRTASPRMRHWYAGYYVHSCPKMRYKGDYAPSQLRCPYTGVWVPLADAAPLLDADKYAVLAPGVRKEDVAASFITPRKARIAAMLARTAFLLSSSESPDGLTMVTELTPAGKAQVSKIMLDLYSRMDETLATRVLCFLR